MESWKIVFWASHSGKKPVEKWIESLAKTKQKQVFKLMKLLEAFGPHLPLPHNRYLGAGVFELRDTTTGPGYRIYYGVLGDHVVIFVASGDKSSQDRDIVIAKNRLFDKET